MTASPQVWQSSGASLEDTGAEPERSDYTCHNDTLLWLQLVSRPCMFSTLRSPFNPFTSLHSPPLSAANQMLLLGYSRKSLLTFDQSEGLLISLPWLVVQMAVTPPVVLTSWYLAITRSCYHFTGCPQINPLILPRWFGFQLACLSLRFPLRRPWARFV